MTAIPAWIGGYLVAVDKMRVHRAGLRHRAVSIFVMRGEEVLLQKRAAAKYHTPGLWTNTCCTHPHWGEAPADGAVRRLREELGVADLELHPRGQVEYRADVGGGLTEHEVVDLFTAAAPPDLAVTPAPDEVAAIRWVSVDALRREVASDPLRFTPWLRIYLDEHLDRILGVRAA